MRIASSATFARCRGVISFRDTRSVNAFVAACVAALPAARPRAEIAMTPSLSAQYRGVRSYRQEKIIPILALRDPPGPATTLSDAMHFGWNYHSDECLP